MRRAPQQRQFFRPASFSTASGVALLLAFLLATHSFWCALGGSDCTDDLVPSTAQFSVSTPVRSAVHQLVLSVVSHSHPLQSDACANVDETKNRAIVAGLSFPAPLLLWVAVVFVVAALVAMPLPRCAAVFGRDGPVSVPPLHSRLVRASLPHRAPPVFLPKPELRESTPPFRSSWAV